MTSLAWGPVGHCTSGRPLNPPLLLSGPFLLTCYIAIIIIIIIMGGLVSAYIGPI